jgi:alpha-ketoglutarate-dependent taurine dioxygenase
MRPRRVERRPVLTTPQGLVRVAPLSDDGPLPALVSPVVTGVDLLAWARDASGYVDELLLEHRALLFRGFLGEGELTETLFADFAEATSSTGMLPYQDRSTPRERVAGSVYTSTVYPANRSIEQHNEGTYWRVWPMRLYFGAQRVAESGGATPIADVRRVLGRLSPGTRGAFEDLGFMLVRNFNDGFGLPWQETFQTDDREEASRYCLENDIHFEWRSGDRLRTEQIRPAIRVHPRTGEPVWFNHAAFFHASAHAPEIRAALTAEVGEDGLPWLTYFGNGAPIPPQMVAEIRAAYRAETTSFTWQPGDIMLLDNMTVSHGREAYEGDRLLLVAMTEPQEGTPA